MNRHREDYWRGKAYSAYLYIETRLKQFLISRSRTISQLPHRLYRTAVNAWERPREARRNVRSWIFARIFNVLTALVLVWICVLYVGEAAIFDKSLNKCEWDNWERWPPEAVPHHLVFISDPQLVDPHTYPGRPWPLSTLTVKHTDLYLRRSYSRIQRILDPSTIIFLGDLFDGGREWSTSTTRSPDERYWRYGDLFWLKEFNRFSRIFLREWSTKGFHTDTGLGHRKIIASLPGNHDLGFGYRIQKPVRDRFHAFFGDSNRIDIIANHTFISLDTVSLSAKEQEYAESTEEIWGPPDAFLADIQTKKREAVGRYKEHQAELVPTAVKFAHTIDTITNITAKVQADIPPEANLRPRSNLDSFPTILLSHVPLYRAPGTPCGPLRERHPPSTPPPTQASPLIPDNDNAIPVASGYQYQNVLTESLSQHIIARLGGDIAHTFSGDDHDYCDLVHHTYGGMQGIREITVKSISWAMGVRRPGFLLVSLWNDLDNPVSGNGGGGAASTLQTHLCLLPDQLSIFIRYGLLFGLSLAFLLARALVLTFSNPPPQSTAHFSSSSQTATSSGPPLLPISISTSTSTTTPRTRLRSTSSASTAPSAAFLMPSTSLSHHRQAAYISTYTYTPPSWADADGDADAEDDTWPSEMKTLSTSSRRRRRRWRAVLDEWAWGLWCVARGAGAWFVVMLWVS